MQGCSGTLPVCSTERDLNGETHRPDREADSLAYFRRTHAHTYTHKHTTLKIYKRHHPRPLAYLHGLRGRVKREDTISSRKQRRTLNLVVSWVDSCSIHLQTRGHRPAIHRTQHNTTQHNTAQHTHQGVPMRVGRAWCRVVCSHLDK